MAEPDLDVTLALPGDAWEALRAYGPGRRQTCQARRGLSYEGSGRGPAKSVQTEGTPDEAPG
jgi:hypothetical protein